MADYKKQTSGNLGALITCPSCGVISLTINADASNNPITYNNDGDACGAGLGPGLFTVFTGAGQVAPIPGMIVYTDQNLQNEWDGDDGLYKITSFGVNEENYVADIDDAGILGVQTSDCY